jgi:hypothetical protein
MKASIVYSRGFRIPKVLPHCSPRDNDEGENQDNIFNDEVFVHQVPGSGQVLRLMSRCGCTDFRDWDEEENEHFYIYGDCWAKYDGARGALNAVWGIEFPECTVTDIESSLGKFDTLEDYDYARTVSMPVIKNVERFIRASHSLNPRIAEQAKLWLANMENALRPVIDMDDPCRNPIHSDGSKGYIA